MDVNTIELMVDRPASFSEPDVPMNQAYPAAALTTATVAEMVEVEPVVT